MPRPSLANKPHSKDLRLNRTVDIPATFFVTKALHPKKPVLDSEAREIIVTALFFAVQDGRIYLRSFVVMPDHWHALFALCEPWTLPKFMHALMSFVAGKTASLLNKHQTIWQDGYYDTRVKTAKQFEFVTRYIEQNPVKRVWSIELKVGRQVVRVGENSSRSRGLGFLIEIKEVAALRPLPH